MHPPNAVISPYPPECVEGQFCELRLQGVLRSPCGYAHLVSRSGGIIWLVAPGLAMIAVTYGLPRFAYGLFLPEMRESLGLSDSVLGLIGAGSYAGYCLAVIGVVREHPLGIVDPVVYL
jgi:hypothetical protein